MTRLVPPYRCDVSSNPSFHVIGLSHHTATVEERERLAFSRAELTDLLQSQQQAGRSALLLSTCNRCELYWSGSEAEGEVWFRELADRRGANSALAHTRHSGMHAVHHLFLVTAGLDSQILGETEILGQVRRAFDTARAAGTTTAEMDLIFSAALSAGRRVRRDTLLGRHPASVSSAAVELASERGHIGPRPVVVLGAGEAAEGALRALHLQGASGVTLLSRHPEKARPLAHGWGAEVGPWEELSLRLKAADLLLVATASGRPVVTSAQLAQATRERQRALLVIDLGMPRNVEPAARDLPGIELLDLDDLQRLRCPAVDGRRSDALAEAERIIDRELQRLGLNLRGRRVAPQLTELHRRGVELAEQESAWALARLETLTESEREVIRQMADRLVRRVLYPVSRRLRNEK